MIEHYDAAWNELIAPDGPFAMTEATVLGREMRVFRDAPESLRTVWESAEGRGDAPYVVFEDERVTYAEMAAQVRSLAQHLHDDLGVTHGDRVAIAMRNYPEWVATYWASVSLGACVVGLNAWWTTEELRYGLADSTPKVLVADAERVERVTPVLDELRATAPLHVIAVRTESDLPSGAVGWDDAVDPATAPATLPSADIDTDDDATIFYTSGTTGVSKGARLSHRASVHNLMHMVFTATVPTLAEQKAIAAGDLPEPGGPPIDQTRRVYMAPGPLFHVNATNCYLHPCTWLGGTIVLMYRWDAGRALELIERERVTAFSGVPTLSRELLAHPDWSSRDTSSLRRLGGGGAAFPPDLVDRIDRGLTNGAPATGYGLTETTGIITANAAATYVSRPTSCGRVVPTLDVRLQDEAGAVLPPGADSIGELCVRGPVVFTGYINQPDATAEALRDGWFRTGDIARIDEDGFVHIVDRAKDMVLRGGENVYCAEVEAAFYRHPDVMEVAVFGIPDERLGESVAAAVVLHPGADRSADALGDFVAERIAAFKVPTTIWLLDQPLPRSAVGKFLKRDLRDQLTAAS